LLEVDQLSCRRGPRLLFAGLSFSLEAGELLHLRGTNGSGKTSLLRIIAGLARAEAGHVRWRGHDTRDAPEDYRAEMLYQGHAVALKDEFSALENLQLSCMLAGDTADAPAACDALQRVGLKGRWDLPVRVLSQGQRRRASLARLWLTQRKLWLLDEPLASLDVAAIGELQARLDAHLADGGSVLLTTHQPLATPTAPRALDLDLAAQRA